MQEISYWCDSRVYRAGLLGSQEVGSWLRLDREEGVALSSSDCNVASRDSRSIIYSMILVKGRDENSWAGKGLPSFVGG